MPRIEEAAYEMRQLTGAILSQNLSALGHPFLTVDTLEQFQRCFDDLINSGATNDMDAAATKIIQISKLRDYSQIEQNGIRCAAAFLKSSANLAVARKKQKTMKPEEVENGEFLAKIALNSIIEFNIRRDK